MSREVTNPTMEQFPDESEIFSDHEDEYEAMLESEGLEFDNKVPTPLPARNLPMSRSPLLSPTQPLNATCVIPSENDGS